MLAADTAVDVLRGFVHGAGPLARASAVSEVLRAATLTDPELRTTLAAVRPTVCCLPRAPWCPARSGGCGRRSCPGSNRGETATIDPAIGGRRDVDVRAAASEVYGVAPADFVATRTRLARQARATGGRDLAVAIGALPKPTLSASAVNLLVRARPDDVERLLTVGARLRTAQAAAASGPEVRDLTREAHRLLAAARSEAETLAREAGQALSGSMVQRVQATLHAGMADPLAAQAVRSGLLVTDLASTGLGPVDVTGALAVAVAESAESLSDAVPPPPPQPARPRAGPAEPRPAGERPVARTVRHQVELRKSEGQEAAQQAQRQAARLAVAAADDAVHAARTRLDDAEAALADLEREAVDRDAEVASLTARLRELRAAQASAVVRERRARSERDQAARALAAARKDFDRARAAVPDRAD